MIEVQSISKRYGNYQALSNVEFSVDKGEIVGFLGPNGAGKTTTMRIICGCIGATQGRALIDGKDIAKEPKAVKSIIGYLPESPPLYPAMIVKDYIEFAAQIKRIKKPKDAANQAIKQAGLKDVEDRIIDHLSKGYRQRVGLAQALVGDPKVLVLDEPTSGLDPAQRKELRHLILDLAQGDRTVILSTHVLSEIEALCKRAVIIANGRVVTQERLDILQSVAKRVSLKVRHPSDTLCDQLKAIDQVSDVFIKADGVYEIQADAERRPEIGTIAAKFGLLELKPTNRLEDIYLRLTQEEAEQ